MRIGIHGSIMSPLVRASKAGIVYLLKDEFTTPQSAPLTSPRTCEPTGTLTITDASNIMSISGGELIFNGTPAADTGAISSLLTRTMGRALIIKSTVRTTAGNNRFGWNESLAGTSNAHGWNFSNSTTLNARVGNANVAADTVPSTGNVWLAAVLRPTGCYLFFRAGDSGPFTLQWVDNSVSVDVLARMAAQASAALNMRYASVKVADLAPLDARFASDYALATSRIAGSVSAGATFTHEANCLPEFTVTTLPSVGNLLVHFAMQDASNYWRLNLIPSGIIRLVEVVAGTPTIRVSGTGVVNGDRVVVIRDGSVIRIYYSNTLKATYSSATNFQSATAGELNALGTGGVISDLCSWPRTISNFPDV